jgi:uncharacterized protein (DUF305 family)
MKNIMFTALIAVSFFACKKSSDTATPAAQTINPAELTHSGNTFMTIKHQTMNSNNMQMKMDADYDFAAMMKMHHQGAVVMANKILAIGTDTTVKRWARNIVAAQNMEIAEMDSFMMTQNPRMTDKGMAFMPIMDNAMTKMDTDADALKLTGVYDYDFTQLMLVHHQSAIDMSQPAGNYCSTMFIKGMAADIVAAQTSEIAQFRAWMATHKPQ